MPTSDGTALAPTAPVHRAILATSVLAATLAATPRVAHAGRWFAEVEPVAVRRGDEAAMPSMFTVSVGRVRADGMLRPFVAVGSGLLNVQARAGVVALARGSANDGPTMHLQVRAMHAILCSEDGVFGGMGLGYRWWRGGSNPFGLLATVEAGPAFLRPSCGPDTPTDTAAAERRWLGGGSVSFTIGF